MPVFFSFLIVLLLSLFLISQILQHNEKKIRRLKKREIEKEAQELNLSSESYLLVKLNEINKEYLSNSIHLNEITDEIAIHKNKRTGSIIGTFDLINRGKLWDKNDSKIVFILYNSKKIIAHEIINYRDIINTYYEGKYKNFLKVEFREKLISELEKKTIILKELLDFKNETILNFIIIHLDKEKIYQITSRDQEIRSLNDNIENIKYWYSRNTNGSSNAKDWANKQISKLRYEISKIEIIKEAMSIYFLNFSANRKNNNI